MTDYYEKKKDKCRTQRKARFLQKNSLQNTTIVSILRHTCKNDVGQYYSNPGLFLYCSL